MLNNDQLTRNERIRLEAIAQANVLHAMRGIDAKVLIETARLLEAFIRAADTDYRPQ